MKQMIDRQINTAYNVNELNYKTWFYNIKQKR